jgi:two-component system, NarL family, response regulator YdfI
MQVTTTSLGIEGGDQGGADEGSITVQIIAPSAVVRAGLAALIGADERFKVLGSFPTVPEAQDEIDVREQPADLIIAEFGESSSDEVIELATIAEGAETAGPAVVALIRNWQQKSVAHLLRSGVSAVLPNTATGEEIIAAVEAVLAGLVVLPRDALEIFEETPPAHDKNHKGATFDREPLIETLTPRERQVLDMMAEGLGNKEIAWQLQISEHTVKFHVSSILAKLNASSRTEAVTQGLRRGLIIM